MSKFNKSQLDVFAKRSLFIQNYREYYKAFQRNDFYLINMFAPRCNELFNNLKDLYVSEEKIVEMMEKVQVE